jgi:hypothetical protein
MSWFSRVVRLVRSGRLNRDLDDEMRFHLDERPDEYVRAGLSRKEARARARRQFGSPALMRDTSRDIKLVLRLESALGKRFFRIDGGTTLVPQEVIGVAKDAKTPAFGIRHRRRSTNPTVRRTRP